MKLMSVAKTTNLARFPAACWYYLLRRTPKNYEFGENDKFDETYFRQAGWQNDTGKKDICLQEPQKADKCGKNDEFCENGKFDELLPSLSTNLV